MRPTTTMARATTAFDQQSVRAAWRARGFSCQLWIDPPEQVRSDFQHDVDELVRLLDGAAEVELNGTMVRLKPGDELRIPAGTRHTVRNCGDGPARWLHGYPLTDGLEADAAQ